MRLNRLSLFIFVVFISLLISPVLLTGAGLSGLGLNPEKIYMDRGCGFQLQVVSEPSGAETGRLIWKTGSKKIVSVSRNGYIKAISPGKAVITVKSLKGHSSSCTVYVYGKGSISQIDVPSSLKTSALNRGVNSSVDKNGNLLLISNVFDLKLKAETKAGLELWKYNGSWEKNGNRAVEITDDEAPAPSIAVSPDNRVYISYYYFGKNDNLYEKNVVSELKGNSAELLGDGKAGSTVLYKNKSLSGPTDLAVTDDGTVVLATVSSGDGYVHYYDSVKKKWQPYGKSKLDNESFWAGGLSIGSCNNTPFVSIRTSSGQGRLAVYYNDAGKDKSSEWKLRGGSYASTDSENLRFQDEKVAESALAVSKDGDVYVAYKCYEKGDSKIKVKLSSAADNKWKTIYSQTDKTDVEQVELVTSGNVLYMVFANYNKGMDIYKLNSCGRWVYEGRTQRPDVYYCISLASGLNGEFYINYNCRDEKKNKVGIFKYTPYQFD